MVEKLNCRRLKDASVESLQAEARFERKADLDAELDAFVARLNRRSRGVYVLLALNVALGLYSAVFPPLCTRFGHPPDVQAVAAPGQAETPGRMEQQPSAQR